MDTKFKPITPLFIFLVLMKICNSKDELGITITTELPDVIDHPPTRKPLLHDTQNMLNTKISKGNTILASSSPTLSLSNRSLKPIHHKKPSSSTSPPSSITTKTSLNTTQIPTRTRRTTGKEGSDSEYEGDNYLNTPDKMWCDLPCENGEENVLCVDGVVDAHEANCYDFGYLMTPEEKSDILDWHNHFRNYAVWGSTGLPRASNMRQLEWNEDLELSATIWLLMCVIGLAKCRRTSRFLNVGQNFNTVGNSRKNDPAPDIMTALDLWAEEEYRATNASIRNYSVIGDRRWTANFVNLVGARTYTLGCASSTYLQSGYHFRSLVCNYGPGLEEGFPVYREGWPCTGCPANWTCRNSSLYPYLCSRQDQPLGRSPPIETTSNQRMGKLLTNDTTPLTFAACGLMLIIGQLLVHTLGIYYPQSSLKLT